MSESAEKTSRNLHCSELLALVQKSEASLPASSASFFGHPPSPTLLASHLQLAHDTDDEVFLLAARTRRCVCVQLWVCSTIDLDEAPQALEPMEVIRLDQESAAKRVSLQEQEEEITCATILRLDEELQSDNDHGSVPRLSRVTVVVGTSLSRVLSVELVMETWTTGQRTLRFAEELQSFFEPLPLDRGDFSKNDQKISMTPDKNDQSVSETSVASENDGTREEESTTAASHDESGAITTDDKANVQKKHYPFCPRGGVTSLNPFEKFKRNRMVTMVWIAYRDGTTVRLHHGGFFSSVLHSLSSPDLGDGAFVRCRVMLPPSLEDLGATVLPLPKYHPSPTSPFSPLETWATTSLDESTAESTPLSTANRSDTDEDEDENLVVRESHEALSFGVESGVAGIGGDDIPALSFYTSENHFLRPSSDRVNQGMSPSLDGNNEFLDSVIGGTKAIVSGVFGGAIGAVKWGLRGGGGGGKDDDQGTNRSHHGSENNGEADYPESVLQPCSSAVVFPGMHDAPIDLFTGNEVHDAPRQIFSVSVDPDGNLAAAADNLGRVQLIDLATKQVIRMWKGVREASCYWIQVPRHHGDKPWQKKPLLYLAIHSKQKRTIEIWRLRHGSRVKSMQVGRDAQIVQYSEASESGSFSSCLLVHSVTQGMGQKQVEPLTFSDEDDPGTSGEPVAKPSSPLKSPKKSTHDAELRLQLLRQLLADTNVPSNTKAVYVAFTSITSLTDLCVALDLLAESPQLEESMGVDGASFQKVAVSFCKQKLEDITKEGDSDVFENPHVKQFLLKIGYHSQLVAAYEVLHKFETEKYSDDDEDVNVVPRSAWAVEALAWMDTYERVTASGIDADLKEPSRGRLHFAAFSKACRDSDLKPAFFGGDINKCRHHVHFTDSTRTRTEVLVHIFRPLLEDVFAFKVVTSIFERLGINEDYDYMLKCFGEWFMTLPARQAARKSFFVWNSPMVRWLQGVATSQLDVESPPQTCLASVHSFCTESPNLIRAFLLATLCREAVAVAARQKEEKTYGKISYSDTVRPWDSLLRKLRVCIFVSLRLHGIRLGAFPITVANVDADDIFSVYEWVARDELLMSHNQEEIATLESACRTSGLVFHPSLRDGDDPLRVKRLQKACFVEVNKLGVRAGSFASAYRDDQPGVLLLYLSNHNVPPILVAHRALLLCGKWGQEPSALHILKNSLFALEALCRIQNDRSLVAAVSIELWQTRIRPVYRAFLFGFHDVPELDEDIVAPLCSDPDWFRGFGHVALEILTIISRLEWKGATNESVREKKDAKMSKGEDKSDKDDPVWPRVKEDFILKRLVDKTPGIDSIALDSHRAVVCASLLSSNDLSLLSLCVPGFYDTFLQSSLFSLAASPASLDTDKQREFVERSIVLRAERTTGGLGLVGPVLDSLELGEIDTLASIWGISTSDVRTTFMLTMYELGKDAMVDDLVTSNVQHIDVDRFVNGGIDTSCRRLDGTISSLRKSSDKRHVIGLLDADTCQWVQERATNSHSFLKQYGTKEESSEVSLSLTHCFILRLLSLSSAAGAKATRVKIHSLSVLSGTILKEQI